jgi:putative membrane protein
MFIDYLTLIMINLVAGTAILAYYVYQGINAEDQQSYAAGFGIVGLLALVLGLALTFTWPLPGSYNIVFGEATTLFGAVFFATAVALYKRWSLTPVAIFAFFAGIYAIIVGARIISLQMTQQPLLSGAGFIMTGLGGLLAVPALGLLKKYKVLRVLAALFLLVTALLWAATFYGALWAHIESFGAWLPPLLRGGQ